MADNVAYTPGSGVQIAADDVGGTLYQRVKPAFGADGYALDVSADNPFPTVVYGTVADSIDNLRAAINQLNRRQNLVRVNNNGYQIVVTDTNSNLNIVQTVNTVTTVTTVGGVNTVTNIAGFGGIAAFDTARAINRQAADGLRSRLTIS